MLGFRLRSTATLLLLLVFSAIGAGAQKVTPPEAYLGFPIGADYRLASYTQLEGYWRKLADESPRMVLQDIGPTAEGRRQFMAIVTSPENQARLEEYRQISRKLALAAGVSEQEARALAEEGKSVVWIDGGLHASEVLGAQQLMEMVYQMVSMDDEETRRFLDDVIILFVQANPDGQELLADWYMRDPDPLKRTIGGLPVLYHKFTGHDNNRDSYMVSQPETENMSRILYIDWMPQIMYNHHQVGPAGAIMFAPPFRYPANYNIHPLVLAELEQVGMAMQGRFIEENKPGVTMRGGGPFSTWWNGGLRTTAYFHNILGLLTETQGNPTPIQIPFVPSRIMPSGDAFMPVAPQTWHFRQSIDYSVTANRAVLDFASRNRVQLLMNIWRAGHDQIERGSHDWWTVTPTRMASLRAKLAESGDEERFLGPQTGALAGYFSSGVPTKYFAELQRPENRDPRGYIVSRDQSDFPTATKFINTLLKNGVTVLKATRDFDVQGKRYPADSWIVKSDQAFRAHVLDMFEPQDHPNDFKYPGGPPVAPYDNAGYTLALQMGVSFDRILEGFEGPFVRVDGFTTSPPPGRVADAAGAAGFLLSHQVNDVAIVTNRLLANGFVVNWLKEPVRVSGGEWPLGTVYVPAAPGVADRLQEWAAELGVDVQGVARAPSASMLDLNHVRIGVWDQYGGSQPSGWTQWLFEQFEFPYRVVYPKELTAGELKKQYDVLIFVTDAIPASDRAGGGFEIFGEAPADIPAEYQDRLGAVTVKETVPQLLRFLQQGGTIVAVGSSTILAQHAGLPVSNHLVDGEGNPLGADQYYIPGSILKVRVDNTQPLAWGMGKDADVFFDLSPVMRLGPAAMGAGVTPVAWFDSDAPLVSGWAWGQQRLEGGVALAEAKVGEGKLFLLGPEVTNRGQPHATFKLLFNSIYLAGARDHVQRPVS